MWFLFDRAVCAVRVRYACGEAMPFAAGATRAAMQAVPRQRARCRRICRWRATRWRVRARARAAAPSAARAAASASGSSWSALGFVLAAFLLPFIAFDCCAPASQKRNHGHRPATKSATRRVAVLFEGTCEQLPISRAGRGPGGRRRGSRVPRAVALCIAIGHGTRAAKAQR